MFSLAVGLMKRKSCQLSTILPTCESMSEKPSMWSSPFFTAKILLVYFCIYNLFVVAWTQGNIFIHGQLCHVYGIALSLDVGDKKLDDLSSKPVRSANEKRYHQGHIIATEIAKVGGK